MKKVKLILAAAIISSAVIISVNSTDSGSSYLLLENIQALTQGESGGKTLKCAQSMQYHEDDGEPTHVTYCGTCSPHLATWAANESTCISSN